MVEIQNFLTIFSKGVFMKKFFVFGCLLLVSQMAMAVNWVHIGNTDLGKIYVDYDSVKLNNFSGNKGKYATTWAMMIYNTPQKLSNNNYYTETKSFVYYDCSNMKFESNNFTLYDNRGNVVWNKSLHVSTQSSDNWILATPDSSGFTQLKIVCSWVGM